MTRSRCGAGTISTPLSRSRARSLPSLNPGNDSTVSDITYLPRKTGQRWEKLLELVATYRPVASSDQPFARDCRWSTSSSYVFLFCFLTTVTKRLLTPFTIFLYKYLNKYKFIVVSFFLVSFFLVCLIHQFNCDRPPHRGKNLPMIWGRVKVKFTFWVSQ
jgi:hypothetical protein